MSQLVNAVIILIMIYNVQVQAVTNVTSIVPGGVILAGGLSVTVTGTQLNTATAPQVVITGTYTNGLDTVIEQYTGDVCSSITDTSLVCLSPAISLDTFTAAGYLQPTDSAVRLLNDATLTFEIGIIFTGEIQWHNFSDIAVYKNPTPILENSQRTYTVWTNRIASIYGKDLDKYITNKTDYYISVSNFTCPIMFVNSTYMWCQLPAYAPLPDHVDGQHATVKMTIGNYAYVLGRIHYQIPEFSNMPDSVQEYIPLDSNSWIILNGTSLDVALGADSYKIQVGQMECVSIQLTSTHIKCKGPILAPGQLDTYPTIANYSQIVVTVPKVTIHHQYVYHLGHVRYGEPDENYNNQDTVTSDQNNTNGTVAQNDWSAYWRWLLLGIALFIGVMFLVCLVCCVCCASVCQRCRRRHDEDDPPLQRGGSAHSSYRSYITYDSEKSNPASYYWGSYISRETESGSEQKRPFKLVREERIPGARRNKYIK